MSTPLISLRSVSKHCGNRVLFEDISFVLNEGERVALIGANGSGKTTLFRMMMGLEGVDGGEVISRRDLRVGYVEQSDKFQDTDTVTEVLKRALDQEVLSDYERDSRIREWISKGGLDRYSGAVQSLSGGWKKRLSLIRSLISEPEVLLLDEPTNHLDVEGIMWLEDLLETTNASVLFISHDRYFIEETATKVIELDSRYPKGFISSSGGYGAFLENRENFLAGLEANRASLANKVRREVEWLRQGVKARGTKAKFRINEAHRMMDTLSSIDLREQKSDVEFQTTNRKSRELLKVENLSQSIGELKLITGLSFVLGPKSRLGIVGNNGSGKSTLIATLIGKLKPVQGRIIIGKGVEIGVFGQGRTELDLSLSLKDTFAPDGDSVVYNDREIHIVSWVKKFLFRTDQLSARVGELSGGEQARVLLAKIMLSPYDILIFDEPTNDLDITTLEVFEEALEEFPGAIVLVTHDRYLLDRVTKSVIGLHPGGSSHIYADVHQWQKDRPNMAETIQGKPADVSSDSNAKTGLSYNERKELSSIEAKIAKLEAQIAKKDAEMHDTGNSNDANRLSKIMSEIGELQSQLTLLFERWETLESKRL